MSVWGEGTEAGGCTLREGSDLAVHGDGDRCLEESESVGEHECVHGRVIAVHEGSCRARLPSAQGGQLKVSLLEHSTRH